MADPQLRVVVLGRSGEAQQQLQHALDELGAQTLAVGDFDQLDPAQIRDEHPDVLLVSMDENTDAARLERWQPLFDDPDATVVFDDADVTSRLSGWDLARWARHLAAKVLGRDDVLPPVRADAQRLPQPQPHAPDDAHQDAPQEYIALSLVDDADFAALGGDMAPAHFIADSEQQAASPEHTDTDHLASPLVDDADFAALSASFDAERNQPASDQADDEPAIALDDLLRAQSLDAADDDGATAATNSGIAGEQAGHPAEAEAGSLSSLSLVEMDVDLSASRAVPAAKKQSVDIDISGFELQPMGETDSVDAPAYPEADLPRSFAQSKAPPRAQAAVAKQVADGLIAIVAGLGGPDAVRQFLGALPGALPVPVLLWQHLDAGKHDRLAQQLGKASKLPVYLAKAGELAQPGAVGVMNAGLALAQDGGWRFVIGNGGASQGLSPALNDPDTVVVVLSGAEPAIVEPAQAHSARGGKVLVQTPATCFDGTAASTLDGDGVIVALPADLAALAVARWAA